METVLLQTISYTPRRNIIQQTGIKSYEKTGYERHFMGALRAPTLLLAQQGAQHPRGFSRSR